MASWENIDFSPIANLGNQYREAQHGAMRERTLADLGSGAIDQDTAIKQLTASGDMRGASLLSNLGNNRRDFEFRQQVHKDTLAQQERQFKLTQDAAEGNRIPFGWQRNPTTGKIDPVKDGPHDPNYVRSLREAQEKPTELAFSNIEKLTEEGSKFSAVNHFIGNFKPEYAGKPFGIGAASNYVARHLPEAVTGATERDAAAYWQGYDRYKNVVRNDLFGSALTATEQAAFEKADINPGMAPSMIKANLAEQQRILQGAMKRKASSLIASKHNPQAIAEAYGVPLKELGVTIGGPSRGGEAAKQTAQVQTWTDPATNKTYKIINGVPHE